MKLNLETPIFDAAAREILAKVGISLDDETVQQTVKVSVCRALISSGGPNENMTADEKLKNYELLLKFTTGATSIDLSAEEVTRIKALVGKVYPTLWVGYLHALLDPKPKAAAVA